MIKGVHTMFYSSEPEAFRAFLRDKLGFSYTDVGEGCLIFDLPEADMGCHPADPEQGAPSGTQHISFYCDDVEKTMAELRARGVEFTDPVADHGYGLVTFFKMPGGIKGAALSAAMSTRRAKASGRCIRPLSPGGEGRLCSAAPKSVAVFCAKVAACSIWSNQLRRHT